MYARWWATSGGNYWSQYCKKCNKCTIAHNVMHITDILKGTQMEAEFNGHFPNSNLTPSHALNRFNLGLNSSCFYFLCETLLLAFFWWFSSGHVVYLSYNGDLLVVIFRMMICHWAYPMDLVQNYWWVGECDWIPTVQRDQVPGEWPPIYWIFHNMLFAKCLQDWWK